MTNYEVVRESTKEYLKIKALQKDDNYTCLMTSKNRIKGILPMEIRNINGEKYYYYDVTGRRVFTEMFKNEDDMMERGDVERICSSILQLCESVREYMLELDEISAMPEMVYYNSAAQIYEFLYIPDNVLESNTLFDFRQGLRHIWSRVMEKFDYQSDNDDLKRIYTINQLLGTENFSPEEVFAPAGDFESGCGSCKKGSNAKGCCKAAEVYVDDNSFSDSERSNTENTKCSIESEINLREEDEALGDKIYKKEILGFAGLKDAFKKRFSSNDVKSDIKSDVATEVYDNKRNISLDIFKIISQKSSFIIKVFAGLCAIFLFAFIAAFKSGINLKTGSCAVAAAICGIISIITWYVFKYRQKSSLMVKE